MQKVRYWWTLRNSADSAAGATQYPTFQVVDYSVISQCDDLSFCEWLTKEIGVAAIPVSAFYDAPPEMRLIRFCFAKTEATLEQAAERLRNI